jgi:hypothetical protein
MTVLVERWIVVMTGCISDGYTVETGREGKLSPDWVHRRLARGFWVRHGLLLFPLCAGDAIMHNVR